MTLNLLFPLFLSIQIAGISTILYPRRCAFAVSSKDKVKPLLDSISTLFIKSLANNLNEFVESLIGKEVK